MSFAINYVCILCKRRDVINCRKYWTTMPIAEADRIIVQANGGIYIGEYRGET